MNSLEFLFKSIAAELVVAVPSLILGAFNKPLGMIVGLIITAIGLYLSVRQYEGNDIGFFEFGVPSIIAAVFVELTLWGIDATWLIVIGVIYAIAWFVADMIVSTLESIFGQ
jgi:hypothetical protein